MRRIFQLLHVHLSVFLQECSVIELPAKHPRRIWHQRLPWVFNAFTSRFREAYKNMIKVWSCSTVDDTLDTTHHPTRVLAPRTENTKDNHLGNIFHLFTWHSEILAVIIPGA